MTAAAGPISLAEDILKTTLADCDEFRSWVRASTQQQALDKIHMDALPPPESEGEFTVDELQRYRPYAVIFMAEEDGFSTVHDAVSAGFDYADSGSMTVELVEDIPDQIITNPAEIGRRFKNMLGNLITELKAKAGTAGYLAIQSIQVAGIYRASPEVIPAQGNWQGSRLRIGWRGGG